MKKTDLILAILNNTNKYSKSKLYNSNKDELYVLLIKNKPIFINGVKGVFLEYSGGYLVVGVKGKTYEIVENKIDKLLYQNALRFKEVVV